MPSSPRSPPEVITLRTSRNGVGRTRSVLHDVDDTVLLHGVEHAGVQRIRDERHELGQTGHDRLRAELRVRGSGAKEEENADRSSAEC